MSEPNTEALPSADEAALKKRLLSRVAIAGGVVVALLGGLAVFDAMFVTPPPAPVAAAPAPEPAVVAAAEAPKPEAPVVAEQAVVAAAEAPAAVPERTTQAQRPLTPPATARPAMIKPAEPIAARPEPGRVPKSAATPLSRPLSKAVQSARQYVVQLGVFNNVTNAEELRAKLELNGIPARIEARVQVGPFASQAEAEAARDRLRALGMDAGMLMAIRR